MLDNPYLKDLLDNIVEVGNIKPKDIRQAILTSKSWNMLFQKFAKNKLIKELKLDEDKLSAPPKPNSYTKACRVIHELKNSKNEDEVKNINAAKNDEEHATVILDWIFNGTDSLAKLGDNYTFDWSFIDSSPPRKLSPN